MGEGQDPDLTRMVRRFDKGDRSPELLKALNQAAFQAFHAPWEQAPQPPDAAATRLRARGHMPLLSGTGHLALVFPFDPKADAQRVWRARVRPGSHALQLICSSDAPLSGYSEAALERLCKDFNDDEGVTTAKVFRSHPSASPRVHVISSIAARVAQNPLTMDAHLAMVLGEDQAFWRLLRQERPR